MGMDKHRALIIEQDSSHRCNARVMMRGEPPVSDKEVLIEVHYSSLNYKDALALSGQRGIVRRLPIVGGIDACGVVRKTCSEHFNIDEKVIITGYGLGQTHDGGYAEYLSVPEDWVVPLPDGLTLYESMALGTAGFTAALAIQRLQDNFQVPEHGPLLVTGATGGVGSFAINILTGLGFAVTALSGKLDRYQDYLTGLGASNCLDRLTINTGHRPLETAAWGGGIDSVGGNVLAWLLRSVQPYGNVAACGLALGSELEMTVMPFILRGVSLLGVASAGCPMLIRRKIWRRLASDLYPRKLKAVVQKVVSLDEVVEVAEQMRAGEINGRYVVRVKE